MNKFVCIGRLGKDPEIRRNNDTVVARFSIAIDKRFKRDGEATADFFDCRAFGKTAEFCEKYLAKGKKVGIVGRMENNNYTDKNGNKVYSTVLMIEEIEFAESKGSENSKPATADADGFMNIPDGIEEELPFN